MSKEPTETKKERIKRLKNIGIGCFVVVFIFAMPWLFTQFSIISFKDTGPIGDTIGGITAPFVNLLAAYLVYRSFQAQVLSNNRQMDAMDALSLSNSFDQVNSIYTRFVNSIEKDNEKHKRGKLSMFEVINFHLEYAINGEHEMVDQIEEKLTCATRHLVITKQLINEINTRLSSDGSNKYYFLLELAAYLDNLGFSKYKDELTNMLSQVKNDKIPHRTKLQEFSEAIDDVTKTINNLVL